jgi:hypothetical protein
MSSVSGVSAAQASSIEQLKAQQAKPGQQGRNVQMDSVLQSLGVDSAKIPAIEKQMHDASESARKGGGQDHAAVRQAIEGVLKNNGIDPAKFDAAIKSHRRGKHHGHHRGAAPTQPPSTPAVSATPAAQVDVEG